LPIEPERMERKNGCWIGIAINNGWIAFIIISHL
jgi:hypothetical protein